MLEAGWIKPLTIENRAIAVQALVCHHVILKRKVPLDHFREGLESLGVLELLIRKPDLMKTYFVTSRNVTVTTLQLITNMTGIHSELDDAEEERARKFFMEALHGLEKG